jgi:hypothetical protein
MKERAKLLKVKKNQITHPISKRLSRGDDAMEEFKSGEPSGEKRKQLGGGKYEVVSNLLQMPGASKQ